MAVRKIFYIIIIGLLFSCEDERFGLIQDTRQTYLDGSGFFIVNEGNFTHSSGSVSFYSFDSSKIYNNIFYEANNRPLGDVPVSFSMNDTLGYVIVNNSSKIEVVSLKTFKSKDVITGFPSPREMHIFGDDWAYVSDLYSDSLTLVDLKNHAIAGGIELGRSSQTMVSASGKVFIANWSQLAHPQIENNMIMITDAENHKLIDSIRVTKEPNSMVVDQHENVWVLCSGGYENEERPALLRIDSETHSVSQRFNFENKNSNPSELAINGSGDTLYFLNEDVYKMPVDAGELPAQPFIDQNQRLFYAMGLVGDYIAVSDAIDYQQKGIVYLYSRAGAEVDSMRAGIIPGFFREK